MRKNFTKKLMLVLFAVLSIGHLSAQNGYDMTLKRPPNSTTEQTQVEQSLPTFPGSAKGKIAYANIIYPSVSQGYKSFDVDNITGATTITPLLDDLYGGDYYNGIFYTHSYDGTFYKINAATGVAIETIPGAWSSYMSDMAYDHVADIMYAVKNLQLYTIDLTTGVPTEVATLTGAANNMLTLAIDATGNMYGITISSGNLYSINKTTGACTLIGNTGRTPSYAQCMGFDHESGTLYWCSSTAYTDDFGTVNVSTGAYTMIQANCYEITGFHIPYSAGGELPPVEAGEAVATIQGANVHLAWEPETTTGLTGFEIYRKDCYATDWEGAELIAGNIPAAQTEFMDYSWAAADYGVYNWGVFAYYESGPTAIYSSNCLDKDMLIEVDVTVTLNSGENATGTVVTFTNTSEPDLELVYEATLPSSGKFTWDEFRKGTYDISVVKDGYTGVDETGYEIYDDESFNWLLTELLLPPSNLYVTPTAYASWQGGVTNEDVVVTIGEGTSGTYEIPINTFYRYTYSQQIFDASEIGHSSGKISSVAFQYIYGTSQTRQDFTVYMANTDKSEFASTTDWIPLNQLQEVFSGSINLNNSGTDFWYTIEFDTEFEYTGGNVVLVVLDNEGSYYTSSNYTFYRHVASGYKTLHYRVDGTVPINPASPPTAYSRTKNRNNVQFGMNVPVRAAELSKVYLDGTFVANTTNQFYQYDPATLTVGETYLSEVLIGYTSGNSARSSYEFTYLGCAAYNAPTALTSVQTVGTKDAVLTWTNPTLTNVDYLRVYRDGELYKDNLSMDTPFTTWTDTDIANGTYNYALTLVYDDGAETCITAATTSITIKSTGTINGTVTYQLGGNVNGATITVSNTSNTYTFTTNASGAYTGAVEAGTYTVKCEFAGHETQTTSAEIVYVGTSNVNFSLFETPVGVDNVEAWVENGAVTISWDGSGPTPPGGNIFDDVEGHTAFTINSPGTVGWSYIDGDGLTTYEFADCDFPGEMEAMAYIVFDPNATSPAVTGGYVSYSGTKYFGCLASYGGANNDWIISPQLNNPSHISFYGKSITVSYGMERFKVGYSTTGMAQADFTFVTPSPYVQVPAEWTLYEYDIPANAKYVAINCVSNDAFMFMVDDITITQGSGKLTFTPSPTVDVPIIARNSHEGKMVKIAPNGQTQPITPQQEPIADKGTRALTGYSVYRTDCYEGELELLGTVPSTTGTFIDNQWSSLDFGVYKWGVKA
ncbi:carboxypeptidase regulatory-like domain-containing protein, partial [Bacteroidales bacterium OttesenSCG-928-L14]|nr:carboxypeptidase regulatory-like domain-containing protein [Bacteroidales bacterium OttesenSCG-928-L14]